MPKAPRAVRNVPQQLTDLEITERNVANAADLARARLQGVADSVKNMKKNIAIQYDRRVARWRKWCLDERCFVDGEIVTEEKLLLLLQTVVAAEGNLKEKNEDGTAKELSVSSYQQWVNAMVNLSERQKKLHLVNSAHPNPRGTLIKDFIGNRGRSRERGDGGRRVGKGDPQKNLAENVAEFFDPKAQQKKEETNMLVNVLQLQLEAEREMRRSLELERRDLIAKKEAAEIKAEARSAEIMNLRLEAGRLQQQLAMEQRFMTLSQPPRPFMPQNFDPSQPPHPFMPQNFEPSEPAHSFTFTSPSR